MLQQDWLAAGYFAELHVDEQTAIVTLTHDPKIDDPALLYSLKTNAYYIGCLGSTKTHKSRLDRLKKAGVSEYLSLDFMDQPVYSSEAGRRLRIALSILAELNINLS